MCILWYVRFFVTFWASTGSISWNLVLFKKYIQGNNHIITLPPRSSTAEVLKIAPLPGVQSTILFCEVFILCFHMARRWIGHMLLKTPSIRGYMKVGYHMSVPCESQVVILYNWRVNINWQLTFNIGLHLPITKFLTGPTLRLAGFEDTWTTISIYLRLPSFESISNSLFAILIY